jgi:hypothetical protein
VVGVECRIAPQDRPVVVRRKEERERREMGGEPLAMVRPQLFGPPQDAHAPVLLGRTLLDESDRAQSADQLVHMAPAAQAEAGHLVLEVPDGEPGFAAVGILCGLEHRDDVKDGKSTGLDEEPHQERIVAVHRQEAVDIEPARLREAGVMQDVLEREAGRASDELPDLVVVHCRPHSAPGSHYLILATTWR